MSVPCANLYLQQQREETKMINAGDTFVTRKSGETVTALEAPEPRGNGWASVLVKTADGRERYTTIAV